MRNLDGIDGFKICGTVINNPRYADDTIIYGCGGSRGMRITAY